MNHHPWTGIWKTFSHQGQMQQPRRYSTLDFLSPATYETGVATALSAMTGQSHPLADQTRRR
jgi:hypothetical protein